MIKRIYTNWNLFRILRLAIGIFIIASGIMDHQWILIPIGAVFTVMTLLDLNSCSSSYCQTPFNKNQGGSENLIFEEVKSKDHAS